MAFALIILSSLVSKIYNSIIMLYSLVEGNIMSIRLIISDMDGTLLDLKEIHFEALNRALETLDKKYIISPEDHVKTFDGLSTDKKLKILAKTRDFPLDKSKEINALKQKHTAELMAGFNKFNTDIINVIQKLKDEGYLFYVASNAVKQTVKFSLDKLGITHLVDKIYSNEEVINSKPSSEIYLGCMYDAGCEPHETLIIEDSKYGRESAVKSGAYVCGVDNSFDFTYERIKSMIDSIKKPVIKWAGQSDVTVLIPMAGSGSRFAKVGYQLPKPLIEVDGKPMIQQVIDNLNMDAQFVFVVQKEHYEKYNLKSYLDLMAPGCKIVQTDGVTEGAACTTLLAKNFINNSRHLIIANSDQLLDWNSCDFMYSMISDDADGGIVTFEASDPKWSYVKLGSDGYACEVAEKKVISNEATVGIYYWKHGSEYVRLAEQMISKNIRVNGEFYVCPVFNEIFPERKRIKTFRATKMWGIGTPEDLSKYLKSKDT